MDLVEARLQDFAAAPRHPWERARLALVSRLIWRRALIRPGDAVIDVGCGDTFVAESLARQYPDAQFYAVDSAFTPELIAVFRQRLTVSNVRLFPSLDDVPADRTASLVLLMDVLEHVGDDLALLQDVSRRRYFGASTRMLVTVPSYARLFCAHDRFLGHYRRYSMRSLNGVLRAAALTPLEEGHFFATLIPIRMMQLLRERVFGARIEDVEGLAAWRGGEGLARLLALVLEWDGRFSLALLRRGLSLPGLSNFALCMPSA